MDWMIDMSFSVLFGLLRRKAKSPEWERAFRKLFNSIGMAYGWTTVPAEDLQLNLPKA